MEKVAEFFYKELLSSFVTPASVVLDGGTQTKKWASLLVTSYNIPQITVI